MKIIQSGSTYTLYNDGIQTHNLLPARAYSIEYDKMAGCFLVGHATIEVNEKIYGSQNDKIHKVMDSFQRMGRSLGVILSGDKGIGKSMFAKRLCVEAVEQGLPVILVDACVPGLAKFIESIDQECLVFFDEFDKTFRSNEEKDEQASLLSLFDGTAGGKKLYVVTCNELYRLNDYIVNRPGRFHYHFRFEYPSSEDIREYMTDKLEKEYYEEIDKVIAFSKRINLNYDCLRAIAFELNLGIPFKDAVADLNMLNVNPEEYDIVLHFDNGVTLHHFRYRINLFDQDRCYYWATMYNEAGIPILDVKFDKTNIMFDSVRGVTVIPAEGLQLDFDDYDEDNAKTKRYMSMTPSHMSFKKCSVKNLHYTF